MAATILLVSHQADIQHYNNVWHTVNFLDVLHTNNGVVNQIMNANYNGHDLYIQRMVFGNTPARIIQKLDVDVNNHIQTLQNGTFMVNVANALLVDLPPMGQAHGNAFYHVP